jgi:hypothetical protein
MTAKMPLPPGAGVDVDGNPRLITGTVTVKLMLTQTREIMVSGHLYSDDTPDKVNQRIDEWQDALDRQAVRCDIVNKEAQIAALEQGMKDALERGETLKAKHAASRDLQRPDRVKFTSAEEKELNQMVLNAQGWKKQAESLRAAISAAKLKIGTIEARA